MSEGSEYDPRLRVPGNMQIVGPSLSGKTTWLYRLVRDAPVYFRRADGSPCFSKKLCIVTVPIGNPFLMTSKQGSFRGGETKSVLALCKHASHTTDADKSL